MTTPLPPVDGRDLVPRRANRLARGPGAPRLLAGLLLLGAACGERSPDSAAALHERSAARNDGNVLLVTIDTLRADHVGCYGGDPAVTPNLDALARSGVMFTQAQAVVPLTLPSHVSLFTGCTPPAHGVHDNGFDSLAPGLPTLAGILQEHGLATAAFVSAVVLDQRFGLARGFQTYDDELPGRRAGQGGETLERKAALTVAHAEAWLRQTAPAQRFFAWVHLYEPHSPYRPPSPWAERFAGRPYDGEIACADDGLGRLVSVLRELGVAERTLVVVLGDHGEAFGEHGERGHGLLVYQTTLRVPLVLAWPGGLPSGVVVPEPVSLVDVLPTVLQACGLTAPAAVQGRSLLDLCFASDGAASRPLYAESLHGERRYGWSGLHSLRQGRWQYIRAPRPELYDLDEDPGEEHDLFPERSPIAAELAAGLQALEIEAARSAVAAVALPADAATLRDLAALGYVGGAAPAGSAEAGADPKDRVASLVTYERAKELLAGGHADEALPLLVDLARESPTSSEIQARLGLAYARLQQYPEAERTLRLALELEPANVAALVNLSGVFISLNQPEPARPLLERALLADPDEALAHLNLAAVAERLGDTETALVHLRRFLELVPDDERAATARASIERLSGGQSPR